MLSCIFCKQFPGQIVSYAFSSVRSPHYVRAFDDWMIRLFFMTFDAVEEQATCTPLRF